MDGLKAEEKKIKRRKVKEEPTIEVIIPLQQKVSKLVEKEQEEEVIEAKRIKVPLLVPHFHVKERIIRKAIKKEIYVETKFSLIKTVSIPKFDFRGKSDVAVKTCEKDLVMLKTPMYEIIDHLLRKIPELEFECVIECKPTEVATAFVEKLETLSEKVRNFVFVPKIVFSESGEILVKRFSKELTFEKTAASVDLSAHPHEVEEFTDPIKTMFGSEFRLSIDRPAIILARKPGNERFEYIELLKRILREIYRIHGRGLPRPAHIEASASFNEVRQDIRADRHIWVLDLDKIEDKIEINTRYLKERLKELYSQNFGFLVLYGTEDKLSKVREILDLGPFPKYHEVCIYEHDAIFKLVQVMWGRLKEEVTPFNLDATVVRLEDSYLDRIEELASEVSTIVSVEPSIEDEENIGGESILHYALKAFIVKYFKEKMKVDKIRTEYEFADGRLDIFVSDPKLGEIAVEVETLYGTGLPMLKLRKRIESRLMRGLKLWIVVPNPQLIIYFKDILTLRNFYRRMYGDKLEFFGIDINSGKIIQITELLHQLSL